LTNFLLKKFVPFPTSRPHAAGSRFQKVKLGAQQADLGPQVLFQRLPGDQGKAGQHLAISLDQHRLHALAQHRLRGSAVHGMVPG
jgi:hypothetical protein